MSVGFIIVCRLTGFICSGIPAYVVGSDGSNGRYIAFTDAPFAGAFTGDAYPRQFATREDAQSVVSRFERAVHIDQGWRAHDIEAVEVKRWFRQVLAGYDRVTP